MASTLPALSFTFNNDTPLPTLPAIVSDDTRKRVFIHRSFHARLNHGVFEDHPDDPSPDNEKYEFLGDSVLGLVVTGLLLEVYPNLHVGSYSKIRALMIGNTTLAAISRLYGLPAELKLHSAQAITVRESPNIQADVFESYVGGLYIDQGLTVVEEWLRALFEPYAAEAYVKVRAQIEPSSLSPPESSPSPGHSNSSGSPSSTGATSASSLQSPTPPAAGHLAFFNQHLQKEKLEGKFYINSLTEATVTTWMARVEIDGKVFGRGRGSTKKAAQNEAAKEALVRLGINV